MKELVLKRTCSPYAIVYCIDNYQLNFLDRTVSFDIFKDFHVIMVTKPQPNDFSNSDLVKADFVKQNNKRRKLSLKGSFSQEKGGSLNKLPLILSLSKFFRILSSPSQLHSLSTISFLLCSQTSLSHHLL